MRKMGMVLFVMLNLFQHLLAQEFTFQLVIEDAAGSKDSITLGYDLNATQGVDSIFNEIDISSIPWDTAMDVRAVSLYGIDNQFDYSITESSLGINCFNSFDQIGILTNHWPVKISWDSTLFMNLCQPYIELSGSDLVIYGDVVCWFGNWLYVDLREQSSVIFETATPLHGLCDAPENVPDSVKFCFVVFTEGFGLPEIKPLELQLYPNPASTTLTIATELRIKNAELKITNAIGQEVMQTTLNLKHPTLNISSLAPGLYYLSLQSEEGVAVKRFEVVR